MKTEIKVAVSYVKITHEIQTVDLPEVDLFFEKGEPGSYKHELFAIFLYGENKQSGHYNLLWLKDGEQHFTDFIPRKDVTSEFWIDKNDFRKKALDLIKKNDVWGYKQITKDQFLAGRKSILDYYIKDLLTR